MPKRHYYVIRSDGEIGNTGTALTLIGRYRPMAALMAFLGFLIGVAVTLAFHA